MGSDKCMDYLIPTWGYADFK